jgi:hypothetical protein
MKNGLNRAKKGAGDHHARAGGDILHPRQRRHGDQA